MPIPSSHRLAALLISVLCAGLMLRSALLPGQVLVPFAPELFAVHAPEARAEGRFPAADSLEGNLGTGDKFHQTLALDRILADRLSAGEFPRWTRTIGGGIHFTPHLVQSFHPLSWTTAWVSAVDAYAWWFVLLAAVFGTTCFGFLRRIGVPPAAAIVGVVAACLGLWMQARIQHLMHLTAAVPAFWILSLLWDLFRGPLGPGRQLGRAVQLAAAVALSWLGAFHQHAVHLTWLAGLWAVALALGLNASLAGGRGAPSGRRPGRTLLLAGAAVAVGGLAAAPQALTSWLAAGISSRGLHTEATLVAHALEADHLLHLLWPDLLHWPRDAILPLPDGSFGARPSLAALVALADPQVTGTNWTETAFGIGAAGTALAALGLATAPRALRWGMLLVMGFAFAVACGAFPFLQVARFMPLFAVADVKRTIYWIALVLPVAAAWGAARLGRGVPPGLWTLGCAGLGFASAGLGVIVANLSESGFLSAVAWLYAGGDADRAAQAMSQAAAHWLPGEPETNHERVAATFFASGAALVLLAILARWGRAGDGLDRVAGVGVLLAAELLWIGRGAFTHVARERVVEPPALLGPVLEATATARANGAPAPRLITLARAQVESPLDYLPPNLLAYYGVEDCATYNPLPPRRMEDFFFAVEPPTAGRPPAVRRKNGVGFLRRPQSLDHPLLDIFGVRYVLTFRELRRPGLRAVDSPAISLPFRLYERTTALELATWVQRVTVVADAAAAEIAIADVARPALHCVLEAVPGAPIPEPLASASAAEIEIALLEEERVVIDVDAEAAGYLRLADPWDPGWTATVDGAPVPIYIADLHLRAVPVPAGAHTVEFRFDGPSVVWPVRLGVLGWALILAGAAGSWWRGRGSRRGARVSETRQSPTAPGSAGREL